MLPGEVGGSNAFNRVAVDLGSLRWDGDGVRLRFKELKEWNSNDSPRSAVEEVFTYFSWFWVLRQLGVAPYPQWPAIHSMKLHLIAPAAYFLRHGSVNAARLVLQEAEADLAAMRAKYPELDSVSFAPTPIVLAGIDRNEFVSAFDPSLAQALIDTGSGATSALEVLRPDKQSTLAAWFRAALTEAGVN